jgi:D-glycero-D-manno-heptose 1,7-bisphosphate phosphatase
MNTRQTAVHRTGAPFEGGGAVGRSAGMEGAVFLNLASTVIEELPDNAEVTHLSLAHGTADGARRLHHAGYPLIVISNQSGVAHGYFAEEALTAVEQRLRLLLAEVGVPLAGFYYCPHHPNGIVQPYATACFCRKPAPGLILRAASENKLDCHHSWFISDTLDNVEAGNRAGCQTILLVNGSEREWTLSPDRMPTHFTTDLAMAAAIVLQKRPQPTTLV